MTNDPKISPEDRFKKILEDLLVVIQSVGRHCATVDELAGMASLALENDGQLRLLMQETLGSKGK
jgi:hypothetical protein